MIYESERPPGVSSVDNRIWDVVNCTAANRTRLPCDPPHVKCGCYLSKLVFFLTLLFFSMQKDFQLEMCLQKKVGSN